MSTNTFKQDIFDLFNQKKGGHVQRWLYNDHIRSDGSSGSKLWHKFISSNKKYYPVQNEIDLIPSLIDVIDKDYDTVIDFGLGDTIAIDNKLIPILNSQNNFKNYAAIDISNDQLNHGIDIIECKFNNITSTPIHGDFYKPHSINGNKRLGLFLGITISNQEMMIGQKPPTEAIIKRIRTLSNTVKGSGQGDLIISFDSNSNLKHALNAYQHPAWVSMMTGLMYDVQDKLKPKGNFNPSIWHYTPIINKEHHVIHQAISPSINQNFSIDGNEFKITQGQKFVVKNNFKYPLELLTSILHKAKLSPTLIKADDNPIIILKSIA